MIDCRIDGERDGADAGAPQYPGLPLLMAAIALAVTLSTPFFLVDVPPVLDYPNHLARLFVLAHPDDGVLSRIYAPHWGLLPNLGVDLIGVPLLKVTPAHVGGRLILALCLFSPVAGVVIYSRVAFRRFTYWSLASSLMAYNGVFFLGFLNFLLSMGVALAGAAAWMAARRRNVFWLAPAVGAMAMAVAFFCHIFGAALLALLIITQELAELSRVRQAEGPNCKTAFLAAARLGMAFAPAAALYLASPLSGEAADPGFWDWLHKAWQLFVPFMSYSKPLTLLTGLVVFGLVVLVWRRAEFAPGTRIALAILALLYVVTPSTFKGGTFTDVRLSLMIGLLIFAGLNPVIAPRLAVWVAAAFAVLIGLCTANVANAWLSHRRDLAEVRAAIADVKPGERVLLARGPNAPILGYRPPPGRSLPDLCRLDDHLAALLVIERRAFWPLLFADPNQQPVVVRPPFDRIAQPSVAEPVEWRTLSQEHYTRLQLASARYLQHWRQNFDYVLLLERPRGEPTPTGLILDHAGDYAALYKIAPPDR